MNWDDLRIVYAVSKAHSYSKAARALQIDETTVSRRLARLENTFGVTLFEAVDGQRLPTPACRAILGHLDIVEHGIGDVERMLQQRDYAQRRLRLTTIPLIAECYIAPHLGAFLAQVPELSLHIDTSDQNLDMSRWEADIAIRLGRPAQGSFLMRKIGELRLCMVRGRLTGAVTVGYPASLGNTPEMRHVQQMLDGKAPRVETTDITMIGVMLAAGRASGVIPEFIARRFPPDAPVEIFPLDEPREVWLLSQSHLRDDSLARTLSDWCAGLFASDSPNPV